MLLAEFPAIPPVDEELINTPSKLEQLLTVPLLIYATIPPATLFALMLELSTLRFLITGALLSVASQLPNKPEKTLLSSVYKPLILYPAPSKVPQYGDSFVPIGVHSVGLSPVYVPLVILKVVPGFKSMSFISLAHNAVAPLLTARAKLLKSSAVEIG